MSIRVYIADDHTVMRGGLSMLIDKQHDMEIVGDADNGVDAEAGIRETEPDVAIIDISMPRMGGIEVVRRIRQHTPKTNVLVLTMHDRYAFLRAALVAGATGFVIKKASENELLTAIRTVARGRTFIDLSFDKDEIQSLLESGDAQGGPPRIRQLPELSDREAEVMRLVAEGYTNRQVAEQICLSVKTVDTYRARLMEKLGLKTRADLVRLAVECGILKPGGSPDQPAGL
jgi:two-component system response regulator NreC